MRRVSGALGCSGRCRQIPGNGGGVRCPRSIWRSCRNHHASSDTALQQLQRFKSWQLDAGDVKAGVRAVCEDELIRSSMLGFCEWYEDGVFAQVRGRDTTPIDKTDKLLAKERE